MPREIATDTPQFRALLALSGMIYHSGHTRQHWVEVTGHDPATVPAEWLKSNTDSCYITDYGRRLLDAYFNQVAGNWAALGIRHRLQSRA